VRGLRFVRELRAVYARVDELAPELRTLLAVATRGA
jgi:hypothetical protein